MLLGGISDTMIIGVHFQYTGCPKKKQSVPEKEVFYNLSNFSTSHTTIEAIGGLKLPSLPQKSQSVPEKEVLYKLSNFSTTLTLK